MNINTNPDENYELKEDYKDIQFILDKYPNTDNTNKELVNENTLYHVNEQKHDNQTLQIKTEETNPSQKGVIGKIEFYENIPVTESTLLSNDNENLISKIKISSIDNEKESVREEILINEETTNFVTSENINQDIKIEKYY